MTKTANKKAIKALPKLRASLLWFKRNTLRELGVKARTATSAGMREHFMKRSGKVRVMDLADLRTWYQDQRVAEIRRYRRSELSAVVPGIVWLGGAS